MDQWLKRHFFHGDSSVLLQRMRNGHHTSWGIFPVEIFWKNSPFSGVSSAFEHCGRETFKIEE